MNSLINKVSKIGYLGKYIRGKFFLLISGNKSQDVFISKKFTCYGIRNISLGNHVYINHDVTINSKLARVNIGNFVQIAPHVSIMSSMHAHDRVDIPMYMQKGYVAKKVVIEDDVWIGLHSIILPGVIIGKGSIIGAGAVVAKSIPPYSVAVGVPAKVVKRRK